MAFTASISTKLITELCVDQLCRISPQICHRAQNNNNNNNNNNNPKRCGFRAVSPVLCNSFTFRRFCSLRLLFGPIFTKITIVRQFFVRRIILPNSIKIRQTVQSPILEHERKDVVSTQGLPFYFLLRTERQKHTPPPEHVPFRNPSLKFPSSRHTRDNE